MTVEELKQRKKTLALTNEDLARVSGVPLGTVQKVMSGETKAPRRETLDALTKALFPVTYQVPKQDELCVHESYEAYILEAPHGENTIEDYLALPDERRVELIDGLFYDMTAPTALHQQLVIEIAVQLRNLIDHCPHDCFLFIAPTDVQLEQDEKTVVQPDIFIICGRDKITVPRIYGTPDFVIEILSPSTKKKDLYIKGNKYQTAGVREYWLVDPDKKQIIRFDYGNDGPVCIYGFDQKVPVLISDGQCEVDFGEISERLLPFFTK